jgi:putative sigma-54 modulation protein
LERQSLDKKHKGRFGVKITITGRHMHVHDSVREYANEKITKLERYNNAIQHIELVVANEGDRKLVEMIATSTVGGKHVGQVEHEDIFAAIDLLIDKMKRQLERTKEKVKHHKHEESPRQKTVETTARRASPPSGESNLETYDEVIEKMDI